MEVKIKDNDILKDATIEIVDGVMVVSPKGVFEPKNGDVIVCSNALGYWTLIVRKMESYNVVRHHAVLVDNGTLKINDRSSYTNPRYATEEEKQKLFDKLAKEGWEWDAECKELVKLKWNPKEGEQYWYPFMCTRTKYSPANTLWNTCRDRSLIDKGWCFKTEQECQAFCDRLNEAINNIKP